ncbi:hypothetical protein BGZ83_002357 [Gryganskiella cystojenkinii]|nr:hypothetical protein BGZ83_002357 [Gryganskiella cystojenkinii]
MTKDYYSILQIDESATQDQIKKAYRKLALTYHPDKNAASWAVEVFQDIQEAYEVLTDEQKRALFDLYGEDGVKAGGGGNGDSGHHENEDGAAEGAGFKSDAAEATRENPDELFNNNSYTADPYSADPYDENAEKETSAYDYSSDSSSGGDTRGLYDRLYEEALHGNSRYSYTTGGTDYGADDGANSYNNYRDTSHGYDDEDTDEEPFDPRHPSEVYDQDFGEEEEGYDDGSTEDDEPPFDPRISGDPFVQDFEDDDGDDTSDHDSPHYDYLAAEIADNENSGRQDTGSPGDNDDKDDGGRRGGGDSGAGDEYVSYFDPWSQPYESPPRLSKEDPNLWSQSYRPPSYSPPPPPPPPKDDLGPWYQSYQTQQQGYPLHETYLDPTMTQQHYQQQQQQQQEQQHGYPLHETHLDPTVTQQHYQQQQQQQQQESFFNSIPVSEKPATRVHPVMVSLKDLLTGATKRFKIKRQLQPGSHRPPEQVLTVDIKPGWKAGTKIKFMNEGDEHPSGTIQDIEFIIQEEPHGHFERKGDDITANLALTLVEALTGFSKTFMALDGERILTVTSFPMSAIEGTRARVIQPGQKETFVGEGMPISKQPGQRGNLVITYVVTLPEWISVAQDQAVKSIFE